MKRTRFFDHFLIPIILILIIKHIRWGHDWILAIPHRIPRIVQEIITQPLMLTLLRLKQATSGGGATRYGGGGVDVIQDFVKGLESLRELHHLSPQNRVLSLDIHIVLRGDVDTCRNLVVLLFQVSNLSRQIIQVFLFPHPWSPRRFPVRLHSFSLPLVQPIFVRTGVVNRRWTGGVSTRRSHLKVFPQQMVLIYVYFFILFYSIRGTKYMYIYVSQICEIIYEKT